MKGKQVLRNLFLFAAKFCLLSDVDFVMTFPVLAYFTKGMGGAIIGTTQGKRMFFSDVFRDRAAGESPDKREKFPLRSG